MMVRCTRHSQWNILLDPHDSIVCKCSEVEFSVILQYHIIYSIFLGEVRSGWQRSAELLVCRATTLHNVIHWRVSLFNPGSTCTSLPSTLHDA